jgi:signal peptide peptidase SppA
MNTDKHPVLPPRLQERFDGQLWYITPAGFQAWVLGQTFSERPSLEKDEQTGCNVRRPTRDAWGDAIAQVEYRDQVAIIPVHGPLLKGATGYHKYYGYVGYEDVHEDLDSARAKSKGILMWMNSPGGTAQGCADVAEHVAAIAKSGFPIDSYTEDQKCSAAEYITAGCTARMATGDAIVGSIGTMMATVSYEKFLNKVGIEFNIFASGKYKAMGHPGKDLTADQKEWLQSFVNSRAKEFKDFLTDYRRDVKPQSMQGQIFTGSEAVENGLIDYTVRNIAEAVELTRARGA